MDESTWLTNEKQQQLVEERHRRNIFQLTLTGVLCVSMAACDFGNLGEARYALVVNSEWDGECIERTMFDEKNRAHWNGVKEICVAYEGDTPLGRLKVQAELDPHRSYYDRSLPIYELKGRQELVFRLNTDKAPIPWQKISSTESSCVRLKTYLKPGTVYEDSDLQRRLENFQSFTRVLQRLDSGALERFGKKIVAERTVQALRHLADGEVKQHRISAYKEFAAAIEDRVLAGLTESGGFFFEEDERRFFEAMTDMSSHEKEAFWSRVVNEPTHLDEKVDRYWNVRIGFDQELFRIQGMSFSDKSYNDTERLVAESFAVAFELLDQLIELAAIDQYTSARMNGLLKEYRKNFVLVTPSKAHGAVKLYEAQVGFSFKTDECASRAVSSEHTVTLVSEDSQIAITIPISVIPNGREFQLTI